MVMSIHSYSSGLSVFARSTGSSFGMPVLNVVSTNRCRSDGHVNVLKHCVDVTNILDVFCRTNILSIKEVAAAATKE